MKSNRNLSRAEGKRLGNVALIAFMLGSLLLLSLARAKFSPIGKTGDTIKAEEQQAMAKASGEMATAHDAAAEEEEEETRSKPTDSDISGAAIAVGDDHAERARRPVCYESSRRSDTCEAAGDVRVVGRAQTVLVGALDREWKVKPYCRKHDAFALSHVKEWTLRPLVGGSDGDEAPRCTVNSSATAFVLSTGGFTGNLFHDYTDVLIPAFITARRYGGDVQLLVSSHKPWWAAKYMPVLQQLSRHELVDADADGEVRCYPRVVVGPTFHRELGVGAETKAPGGEEEGVSMPEFRAMLRRALGLERAAAAPSGDRWDVRRRPRLLIISRRQSRRLLNERAMADMATSLGFDVRVGDPEASTDVARFARLVNSADVMVGVHGDGLTNMVFLPAGAVLVQVVPYGGLEWLARGMFRDPAAGMQVHYLEYVVRAGETTLSEEYGEDDPVIRDPAAVHRKGWDALKAVYLDKQDVRPHLGRLRNTLLQALKLLPHGRQSTD
ncbi:Alpha-1,3-arabinosyltransferase XAT3 [Zea mays]|uniref:Glycosyltransferase family 61 protein n=1 Tax=Zea mays TaxID=4577 RepID=A0A1D6LKS7_MAIZE|nr:Alpha-1,3-arabinosyltransferase XAT3 [Zea mays]AQK80309.1 Glycosyltransferase family 61 protein [Zea mays]|eukprot:NP_001310438.1 uncharacterized LOC103629467 [Zea mays]